MDRRKAWMNSLHSEIYNEWHIPAHLCTPPNRTCCISTEETRRLRVEVGEAEIGAGEVGQVAVATPGVTAGFNKAVVVANRIWVFE